MRVRALALGLLAFLPGAAHADLGSDLERLQLAWSAFGHITHLKPRFLERGDLLPILMPVGSTDPATSGCLTVVILAPTSIHFVVDYFGSSNDASDAPEGSLAGALELSECGPKKALLARVAIQMRSPRGAIETLIVSSERPLPSMVQVLPHRDPGPIAPLAGAGIRPSAAPISSRVSALERNSIQAGAVEFVTEEITASLRGTGEELLALGPGCHRLDLLAEETGTQKNRAVDLDIEVTSAQTGEVLADDRSESTDASVTLCTGHALPVTLRYAGAPPRGRSKLARSRFELDAHLPSSWDPEFRAAVSAVLRHYRLDLSGAGLVDTALGVQGSTHLPFDAEPGACYVVIVVRLRGEGQGLQLSANVGENRSQNRSATNVPGTLLAFCATSEQDAALDVDSRGLGLVWVTALFQTGRVRIGSDGS